MKAQGVKQKPLAEATGISQAAINNYLNQDRIPGVDELCKLADFFNLTADELLGRSLSRQGGVMLRQTPSPKEVARLRGQLRALAETFQKQLDQIYGTLDELDADQEVDAAASAMLKKATKPESPTRY
jgi:transcriptional regulator with XRE-family HTH domain